MAHGLDVGCESRGSRKRLRLWVSTTESMNFEFIEMERIHFAGGRISFAGGRNKRQI